MEFPKIGMRTIKTGVAVILCMLIAPHIGVESLFYSLNACVISLQGTVKGSLKMGLNRLLGTVVGGVVGYLIALINPGDPTLCGIGIIITIFVCNIFKVTSPIVGCVTMFAINIGVGEHNPLHYSIHRVIDTSIGIVFALVVNYFMARPNYLNATLNAIKKTENKTLEWIKMRIVDKKEIDASELRKVVQDLDSTYSKYLDEVDYSLGSAEIYTLEKTINICRQMYYHIQSICLLEDKLYLKMDTYNEIKEFFDEKELDWPIDEEKSPVFNYHLTKVLSEIEALDQMNSQISF